MFLITSESLRSNAQFPQESLDDIFHMTDQEPGWSADCFVQFAAKLARRTIAAVAGIAGPRFTGTMKYAESTRPWVLKLHNMAGAMCIQKIGDRKEFWRKIHSLGDQQSSHVLEEFVPGYVFHFDSLWFKGEMLAAIPSAYGTLPLKVTWEGGIFTSQLISPESQVLFQETSARVGGAFVSNLIEAGTGLNFWAEWARINVAIARGDRYSVPAPEENSAGLLISLAREEWPDTSGFKDPELTTRIHKKDHVGFVLKSADSKQITELLSQYTLRVEKDFYASAPARDKPNA